MGMEMIGFPCPFCIDFSAGGMNITFVTSAETDEEGYALLKEFGLPFKNAKKD